MSKKDGSFIVEPTGPTKISNPAVNYGVKSGTTKYHGYATSWEKRVRFGKHMPIPWLKHYTVTAASAEAAASLLARLAARDGYALGGILDIEPCSCEVK